MARPHTLLTDDEINKTMASLRPGRRALAALRRALPADSPLSAQTKQALIALDGMAETLTGDRDYFTPEG
jgi:hypothetical protein